MRASLIFSVTFIWLVIVPIFASAQTTQPIQGGSPTLTTTETINFTSNLYLGLRNSDILILQQLLQRLGYFSPFIDPTGYFGPITKNAVQSFQAANGIPTTGYAGILTRSALAQITVPGTLPPSPTPVPPPLPGNKFNIGDRVQTTTTLNVRATPSILGVLLGAQQAKSLGTVVGGPVGGVGEYIWWNINYDNAPDGWSVENFLAKVSPVPPPPPSPSPQTQIPIYFTYAISDNDLGPYTLDNGNSLANTAIIQAKWALLNPARGVYDWSTLDKKLSDWTAGNPAKKMIIRISPYTGDCERDTPFGDNDGTPKYIYDTVPRITFDGGGVCKTKTDKTLLISVPKVWDPRFLPLHEEFITALANRYNNDSRVAGFQIGFGHIGTWNAQPSNGGGTEFINQGWTLAIWEKYTTDVIDAYRRHFTKPLMVRTARKFIAGQHCGPLLRDPCGLSDNPETAKRILGYAAQRGVNVFLSGLDPNTAQFQDAMISELTTYLGNLNPQPPAGFTLIYGDDFPLWVAPDRQGCPGNTCGRNEAGFDKELSYIFDAWKSINKKYPIAVNFLEPEMSTTNKSFAPCPVGEQRETKCFRQSVYDIAVKWLSTSPAPIPPPPPPTPVTFCTQEVKLCPDGSYVGRISPTCEFAACPSSGTTSGGGSPSQLPPAQQKFKVGDRIITTAAVNVRASASSDSTTWVSTQPKGALGSVISGPVLDSSALTAYWYWDINYDSGADGWSVENYLQAINSTSGGNSLGY